MKLRKRLCDEMQPSYAWKLLCPGVVKSMEKHRKLKDFHFSNNSEEGKLPRTH